jgi:hypothetical protein
MDSRALKVFSPAKPRVSISMLKSLGNGQEQERPQRSGCQEMSLVIDLVVCLVLVRLVATW